MAAIGEAEQFHKVYHFLSAYFFIKNSKKYFNAMCLISPVYCSRYCSSLLCDVIIMIIKDIHEMS